MSYNQWYLKFNEIPFWGDLTVLGEILSSLQILHKWLLVNLFPGCKVLNHRSGCTKDNLHVQLVSNFKNNNKKIFFGVKVDRTYKKE